jgi:hypothetical protein
MIQIFRLFLDLDIVNTSSSVESNTGLSVQGGQMRQVLIYNLVVEGGTLFFFPLIHVTNNYPL